MKLAFIGYGALGSQIIEMLRSMETPIADVIYFDDVLFEEKSGSDSHFRFEDFRTHDFFGYQVVLGLGYRHLVKKREIINLLLHKEITLLTFIHPTSYVSSSATIEAGVIVYPMCTIDNQVTIKTGALVHNGVIVSHDSVIGSCAYLSPGVVVSGNVILGDCSFLGARSTISNGIKLGDEVTIGIGSVVTHDIDSSMFAIGNPAMIKTNLNLK